MVNGILVYYIILSGVVCGLWFFFLCVYMYYISTLVLAFFSLFLSFSSSFQQLFSFFFSVFFSFTMRQYIFLFFIFFNF